VIVDTVEDVSQIGQRIETVQLGGFDDGRCTRECFRPGIGSSKQPILTSNSNRVQGTFSGIVVDSHAPVRQKQAESILPGETVAEGFAQVAFTRDAQELLSGPDKEGRDLWLGQLLARRITHVSGLAVDIALDVVELADPVECFAGDLGLS